MNRTCQAQSQSRRFRSGPTFSVGKRRRVVRSSSWAQPSAQDFFSPSKLSPSRPATSLWAPRTSRALRRSSRNRAFSRSVLASACPSRFSPADFGFDPRFCDSAASEPSRAACHHAAKCDEDNPSRLNSRLALLYVDPFPLRCRGVVGREGAGQNGAGWTREDRSIFAPTCRGGKEAAARSWETRNTSG